MPLAAAGSEGFAVGSAAASDFALRARLGFAAGSADSPPPILAACCAQYLPPACALRLHGAPDFVVAWH